jgi:hypothetical protein
MCRKLEIDREECLRRAAAAYEFLHFRIDSRDETSIIGVHATSQTASVSCLPISASKTWVHIFMTTRRGGNTQFTRWLQRKIVSPREASATTGFFPDPGSPGPDTPATCRDTPWDFSPGNAHRGKNGQRFQHVCPANGCNTGNLSGTDEYSDDSSVCLAAVHAGLITFRDGGTVTYEIAPSPLFYYEPTRRFGVVSDDTEPSNGAFKFPK